MNSIKDTTDNWSKNEFIAFLMLHIGNADLKLSREELLVINNFVGEEQFNQINWVWSESNDIECINIIRNLRKKFFPGDDGKELLLGEMNALAMSDNSFSMDEEMMIRSLRKLL